MKEPASPPVLPFTVPGPDGVAFNFFPPPLFMYVFACCGGTIGGFSQEVSRRFTLSCFPLLLPLNVWLFFLTANVCVCKLTRDMIWSGTNRKLN